MGLCQQRPNFSLPQLKCLLWQMLQGIDYLHGVGIIHRDIKGSNFLIGNDGILKYCDFGLARLIDKNQIVMTSRVITRWYRAPELFLGENFYDEKVDIWSIGCVFVELVTNGTPPFKGDSDEEIIRLIGARCPFPKPDTWPALEKMQNYQAFKGCLYSYFQRSQQTGSVSGPNSSHSKF